MNIGLLPIDGGNFPNLALMKVARFYKESGANVEFYTPFTHYDCVYMSKIFTFTPDYQYYIANADHVFKGGTGYDYTIKLPPEIDSLQPFYNIFNVNLHTAYGFLTRGCVNSCKWCIVPKKEGVIKPYMDVEQIAIENRKKLILMDNNILSCDYGFCQIEKIIKNGFSVDFNQGLDARKIDFETAKLLARVKWLNFIRLACDTSNMIDVCLTTINNLRLAGFSGKIFIYMILNSNFYESFERVNTFRALKNISPFAQPFRDFGKNKEIPQWQKDLARWVNRKELFKSTDFKDFQPRKGFKCQQYFNIFKNKKII